MHLFVTRMLTTVSLMLLLLVAAVGVRLTSWSTEKTLVHWPAIPQLTLPTLPQYAAADAVESYQDAFVAYELPELKLDTARRIAHMGAPARPKLTHPRIEFQRVKKHVNILDEALSPGWQEESDGQEWRELQGSTSVPEFDIIEVEKVEGIELEPTNLIALADQIVFPDETETMIARAPAEKDAPVAVEEMVGDVIKTSLAAPAKAEVAESDAEPEFFVYPPSTPQLETKKAPEQKVVSKAAATTTAKKDDPAAPATDAKAQEAKKTTQVVATVESAADEYSLPEDIGAPEAQATEDPVKIASSQSDDLITYSYISTPPTNTTTPTLAATTTPKPPKKKATTSTQPQTEEEDKSLVPDTAQAQTLIKPFSVSTQVGSLANFELRAQDDGFTILQDGGSGEVLINEEVTGLSGSRSFALLHNDHVVTHVDVPLIAGQVELFVPVMERTRLASFAVNPTTKPLGFLLVKLDEETESISVDGLTPVEHKLTEDFQVTTGNDHSYILLAGVEVGNRTLSARRGDGSVSKRVVHVFEEEVTFDANMYGASGDLLIALAEEDVLSQEKKDLVISGDDVSLTLSGDKSQKVSTTTYRLKPAPLLLGARHYVTLSHQAEELYLGMAGSGAAEVPSEAMMNAVIQKFGIQGHPTACVIQVNLDKKARRYEVMAESYQQSHVSYGMVLDKNGQFYDTLGTSSRRLFIMSENQSGEEAAMNAKVNIRIEYLDGSKRSLSSFCSPNSYLVEQL